MRSVLRPLVLSVCMLGSGCQFVCHIGKNLVREPQLACDEKLTKRRTVKLGKQAWNQMVHQYGETFSCHYRDGFVDGFSDYLYYGGCVGTGGCCAGECDSTTGGAATAAASPTSAAAPGGPPNEYPVCPAVPPSKYRSKRFMTPEGYQAIEDWYAGFRHGAATAMASGLRQLVVLPVQCPPRFGPDDAYQPVTQLPRRPTKPGDETPMPPPEEIVPPSREPLPTPRPASDDNPLPPLPPPGS